MSCQRVALSTLVRHLSSVSGAAPRMSISEGSSAVLSSLFRGPTPPTPGVCGHRLLELEASTTFQLGHCQHRLAHSAARRHDVGAWNTSFGSLNSAAAADSFTRSASRAAPKQKDLTPAGRRLSSASIGVSSQCGRRADNEDRTVVCELEPGLLMVGIFDGHGGSDAVEYVVRCLPGQIAYRLHKEGGSLVADLGEVLRKAFVDVNSGLTEVLFDRQRSLDKAPSEKTAAASRRLRYCGTTATVCLLRQTGADTELTVGHVGDSRALLGSTAGSSSNTQQLTHDHRPELPGETERIVSCDGHVTPGGGQRGGSARVNGVLEMTRSIGDVELKRYGVTAEPDVYTATLNDSSDAFLALITDGIHAVLRPEKISELVTECTESTEAARNVVETAILAGSHDNCTAVVVPLGAWSRLQRGGTTAPRTISFGGGLQCGFGLGC